MPEVGTPRIDFAIVDLIDPKYILLEDMSEYYVIENSPTIVEITTPGASTPEVFTWIKNQKNSFNSNNLNLTCGTSDNYADLPDGIYKIVVKGSPDSYRKEKYYLRTDNLRFKLFKKTYEKIGLNYNNISNPFRKWFNDVNILLNGAKGAMLETDLRTANRLYNEALKMVECKNCY